MLLILFQSDIDVRHCIAQCFGLIGGKIEREECKYDATSGKSTYSRVYISNNLTIVKYHLAKGCPTNYTRPRLTEKRNTVICE
jgi:hypothetical protein